MDTLYIILAVVGVLLLGGLITILVIGSVKNGKRQKEAMASGDIIQRPNNYESLVEIFTLHAMDPNYVGQAIMSIDYSRMKKVSMRYVPEQNCFAFQGQSYTTKDVLWTAKLSFLGMNETQMGYRFEFTRWMANLKILEMNQLLTAIERTFLQLDPQTSVQTMAQENVRIK